MSFETASSPCLRRCRGSHLSSGDRRERHWHIARWLLFPLATLQLARLIKTAVREKRRNTALPSVAKQVASDIESSVAGAASRRLPESVSDHSQRSPMRQARANENRRC